MIILYTIFYLTYDYFLFYPTFPLSIPLLFLITFDIIYKKTPKKSISKNAQKKPIMLTHISNRLIIKNFLNTFHGYYSKLGKDKKPFN
jgi:hypothetical protein